MVEFMDKQKGLDILGLGPSATRTDARTAFRRLAKTWHPDRFATDPLKAKRAEEKMKQVNEAFHFLLPLLPKTLVGQGVGQNPSEFNHDRISPHDSRNGAQSFFSTLVAGFKKYCNEKRRADAQKTGRFGQAPSPGPHCRAGTAGRMRQTAFEAVFQSAVKHNRAGGKLRPYQKKRPVGGYASYRRYVNSVPGRSGTMGRLKNGGRGPVEEISPVAPVKRL
jgi:curved DNA-binding protein CbpA